MSTKIRVKGGKVYMLHCQMCNVEMFNIWYNRKYCSGPCQSKMATKLAREKMLARGNLL